MAYDEGRGQQVYSFMPIADLIFTTTHARMERALNFQRGRPKLESGHSALVFDPLIMPYCGSY